MEIVFFTLFLSYTLLFFLGVFLKDNSLVDIFWGTGFIIITLVSFFVSGDMHLSNIIFGVLILLWGIRLSSHIAMKKRAHPGEDKRYKRWRDEWKYFYLRSFLQVYMLQGLLMCVVAIPIFVVYFWGAREDFSLGVTLIGAIIALFGLSYEARADWELSEFKKFKKPGEILTSGLRKYSRYPQYFGESMFWLGVSLIAAQVSLFAFIGWLVISYLVRYVSGVPLLEKRYEGNEDYAAYSKKTPIFIPKFFRVFT